MKKIILFLITLLIVSTSCNDNVIKKPNKLISRDEMINIIYDLSVLEALKSQNAGIPNIYPKANEFLKSKYKLDSLTFAQNTQYYAADVEEYKKMYEEVKAKLNLKIEEQNGINRIKPPTDEGIVK